MNEVVRRSKRISRLLRHTAGERSLGMTPDGWSSIQDVCAFLDLTRAQLDEAVAQNDKRRLQVDGDRIRACQGHSRLNMPVTLEALEASWAVYNPNGLLWHATTATAVDSITATGLHPGRRTHVHLTQTRDSPLGRRMPVQLAVDPVGLTVFEAPNGVLLTRGVPPENIVKSDAVHRARWSGS